LQRFDAGFLFDLLKAAYSQADNWLVTNPSKAVTRRLVAGLFRAAYTITATTENANDAFAATGNYHYRSSIISDEDSEPPEITRSKDKKSDENLEETEDGHTNAASSFRVNGPIFLHLPLT
jgi:hypothetical protein